MDSNWRMEVLNTVNSTKRQYPMIFSSKDSIRKIQEYLQRNNIPDFTEFIETKGKSAMEISQYLREEIKQ